MNYSNCPSNGKEFSWGKRCMNIPVMCESLRGLREVNPSIFQCNDIPQPVTNTQTSLSFFFFVFLLFLGPSLQHMEVPRLGV